MDTETLICAHGNHPFERERKRGRKPLYCEDHQPIKDTTSEAPKASVARISPARASLEARVSAVLLNSNDKEAKMKLSYAFNRMDDEPLMAQVVNDILRREERQAKQNASSIPSIS